jgi:putative membrane protein
MNLPIWCRVLVGGMAAATLLWGGGSARGETPATAPASRDTPPPAARGPERVKIGEPAIADPHRPPGERYPVSDAEVLSLLHEIDRFEMAAGDLARRKGQSPAVRDFGAQLARDHRAADDKVMSYARRHDADLEHVTDNGGVLGRTRAEHDQQLSQLRAMEGVTFDRNFSDMMVKGHDRAIGLVTSADVSAVDPELKALLHELLPKLSDHEEMAQRVRDTVNRPAAPASAPAQR